MRALENVEAAKVADTLVLVVKPQDIRGLLAEIRDHVAEDNRRLHRGPASRRAPSRPRSPTAVPSCASCPTRRPSSTRAWPRSPPGGTSAPPSSREAKALLAATGKVAEVPEYLQDAVTAISGSGPAYIFYVVEAMIEAGVVLGMPRTMATELVVQTLTARPP